MRRSSASAVWEGSLTDGKGSFQSESGVFRGNYSAATRFGEEAGTNPEELLAAAHAACFSMALANGLTQAGTVPRKIETRARCTIDKTDEGFRVQRMQLEVRGKVPGADASAFAAAAEKAKEGCPISRALRGNVAIEVEAELEA